jgi:hypothetical protein
MICTVIRGRHLATPAFWQALQGDTLTFLLANPVVDMGQVTPFVPGLHSSYFYLSRSGFGAPAAGLRFLCEEDGRTQERLQA